jgi:D-alanyl-D-alanine carboxypeptidase (penicillin-binding protein 5/6)
MKHLTTALLLGACLWSAKAAESYIIVDNQSGVILDSKNKDAKLPVASLTKVATAIVVLDWATLKDVDLSTLVEVPATARADGSLSSVGLLPGDSLSLRDLLYCALLASDNIAAHTLAEHIGARISNPQGLDPAGNFVAQMNALARSLFMKRTLFLNPSGIDHMSKGAIPHSTAADMARLVQHAYNNPGFTFYVSQKYRQIHVFRGGIDNAIEIKNTNELLGRSDIDGVKTGRTKRAGDCLILSAARSPESRREGEQVFITPRRINVVLLRSEDRFRDGFVMLKTGWRLYDAWAAEGRPVKKTNTL